MARARALRQAVRAARLVGLLLLGLVALPSRGQVGDPAQPSQVKAAYLLNFLRYTEWPPTSFASDDAPFRVVVMGDEAVADALEEIAGRAAKIRGRALEIRAVRLPRRSFRRDDPEMIAIRSAHALYVEDDDPERVTSLLEALEGSDVLTVGGEASFAALGGMIGLRHEGRRILFDANPDAIRRSQLQVSARVLQLARVVGPRPS